MADDGEGPNQSPYSWTKAVNVDYLLDMGNRPNLSGALRLEFRIAGDYVFLPVLRD
jgi:hypothetical protein